MAGWVPDSSSESSLLSDPESEQESELALELALPELCGAWPEGLGGLWCNEGLGEPLDSRGLTGVGESTCSGVNCFGGDAGLFGLSGLVGDIGPTGDRPIGDIGARGGGAGVIAGINGVDKLQTRDRSRFYSRAAFARSMPRKRRDNRDR